MLPIGIVLSLGMTTSVFSGRKKSFGARGAYHGQWYIDDDLLYLSDSDDENCEKMSFLEFLKKVLCCKGMPNLKTIPRRVLKKLLCVYKENDDLESLNTKKEN